MSANALRKLSGKIPTGVIRFLGNLWPPYLGAGIHIQEVSSDFRRVRVRLKRRWYNTNYVGTQYGGSMYSMTDPFYMLMLINNLGPKYIVWDKAASIRFRKPGTTDLFADFQISAEDIEAIKTRLLVEPKLDWERDVLVKDVNGETIAEVHKVIYIKMKAEK